MVHCPNYLYPPLSGKTFFVWIECLYTLSRSFSCKRYKTPIKERTTNLIYVSIFEYASALPSASASASVSETECGQVHWIIATYKLSAKETWMTTLCVCNYTKQVNDYVSQKIKYVFKFSQFRKLQTNLPFFCFLVVCLFRPLHFCRRNIEAFKTKRHNYLHVILKGTAAYSHYHVIFCIDCCMSCPMLHCWGWAILSTYWINWNWKSRCVWISL